jgi:hypothetical protein
MNLITITDEMLESAHIEESDRENLKKARCYGKEGIQINLESSIAILCPLVKKNRCT